MPDQDISTAEIRRRFVAHFEARGHTVVRFAKPTFTKPAPIDLRHEISTTCDVVIEALAD